MFIEHLLFSSTVLGGKMDEKMNERWHQDGVIVDYWNSLLLGCTEYIAKHGSIPSEKSGNSLSDSYTCSMGTKKIPMLKWIWTDETDTLLP